MMTRRDAILTGAGLAAGLLVPVGSAHAGRRPLSREPEGTFFPWQQIADGVHAVVDFATGGNVMLVAGGEESIIVDTKFPSIAQALIRESGARAPRIRHAVNTHHHADHTGGNAVFAAAGVSVIAHAKAEPRIEGNWQAYSGGITGGAAFVNRLGDRPTKSAVLDEAGGLMSRFQFLEADDWKPSDPMTTNERTLRFGGRGAELIHFGQAAHTDNDVVVHLRDADVLHTGDLVFAGLHPFFDPGAGVSAKGWIQVLAKVRALCGEETVVVPGHGPVGDASIIDAQRAYLEQLIEAVQRDIEEGLTKEQAAAKTYPFMEGLGFEQIRPRAIAAVWDELGGS